MDREATLARLIKFSIQLYLPGPSLSNTAAVLEVRFTGHHWVHKADLDSNDRLHTRSFVLV